MFVSVGFLASNPKIQTTNPDEKTRGYSSIFVLPGSDFDFAVEPRCFAFPRREGARLNKLMEQLRFSKFEARVLVPLGPGVFCGLGKPKGQYVPCCRGTTCSWGYLGVPSKLVHLLRWKLPEGLWGPFGVESRGGGYPFFAFEGKPKENQWPFCESSNPPPPPPAKIK